MNGSGSDLTIEDVQKMLGSIILDSLLSSKRLQAEITRLEAALADALAKKE